MYQYFDMWKVIEEALKLVDGESELDFKYDYIYNEFFILFYNLCIFFRMEIPLIFVFTDQNYKKL